MRNLRKRLFFIITMFAFLFAAQNVSAQKHHKKHSKDDMEQVETEPDAPVKKSWHDEPLETPELADLSGHGIIMNNKTFRGNRNSNINNKFTEGIDISHYQGSINWDLVSEEPISYVYIKATEGASYVDRYYEYNRSEARRVGLSVGSYHFYRPNISPKVQFANMTRIVKPEEQDLVPLIDIEFRGKEHKSKFIADLREFVEMVTAHYGKKPLLYTYHNFYNNHLLGEFGDYQFMIARYQSNEPWLNDGKDYIMWQYSDKGSISGIKGNVDRSRIMGSYKLHELGM